jgi:kumamolisin
LVLPFNVDQAGLERFASSVSTPGSPQYGRYASLAELERRFGASAGARRRVLAYLRRVGASGVSVDPTGLFADATMSVGLAERLFAAPLTRFRSARDGRFIAPSTSPVIPAAIRGVVTGVVGLDTRPLASPDTSRARSASQPSSGLVRTGRPRGCGAGVGSGGFTPNQYLTAYGLGALHAAGFEGQGLRVALIEIDGFKHSDVLKFAKCFRLKVPRIRGFGVGVSKPLRPGGEATLDIEVLDAVAPRLKEIDVYESHALATSTLKALTAPLRNRGFKPAVISASLGLCEQFVAESVGRAGIIAAENALRMAAASGISVLASSGDAGSADCISGGNPLHRLAVNFPSSSPWVTGVGGTNLLLTSRNLISRQIVWNDASELPGSASGGGSSIVFARPGYQKGTVAGPVRTVPDISALADVIPGYAVYCSASGDCLNMSSSSPWQGVGGTSAATPLLAGGTALVDQVLRRHHRHDIGFINPLLYAVGRSATLARQVFFDVTVGNNDVGPFIPGNGQPLGCCAAGPGYDLASGWGSVNFATFAGMALAAGR